MSGTHDYQQQFRKGQAGMAENDPANMSQEEGGGKMFSGMQDEGRRDPALEAGQYGSDSGLTGSEFDTQNVDIPGAGRMGGQGQGLGGGQKASGGHASRGYERDNDEYSGGIGSQGKPGLTDKIKGGVEKMAGKVTGESGKGQERQSGGNF